MSITYSRPNQTSKLPLLKDYTKKKKEMLKTFFTSKTSRSESRSKLIEEKSFEEKSYYFDKSLIKKQNTTRS